MSQHLMIVPTTNCPASCSYCFGPHRNGPAMTHETLEAIVRWQTSLGSMAPVQITFHGGEPLVPGVEFYRFALPTLRQGLAPRRVRFSIQSNLWSLTDEKCELFREYGVCIGTSLDGPEHINDAQRGPGYFRSTMAGVECARRHGLQVGCISTFTLQSARHVDEIFSFFVREGLDFSVHAALPSLDCRNGHEWALPPEAYGQLMVDILDMYVENPGKVRIGTLDSMCRSVSAGQGGLCTFDECLGKYLTIAPEGEIYPCQRFIGMTAYELGKVQRCPSMDTLSQTTAWRMLQARQDCALKECKECLNLNICRGGCPYNALTSNDGRVGSGLSDPYCVAYRRVFDCVVERAMAEVFSEDNLAAVVDEGPSGHGLLRKGNLLQIMRSGSG